MITARNTVTKVLGTYVGPTRLLMTQNLRLINKAHFSSRSLLLNNNNNTTASKDNANANTTTTTKIPQPTKGKSKWGLGIGALVLAFGGYKLYQCQSNNGNNDFITIHEDLKPYTMKLSTEDNPFQTNYTLVGSGVRTLSISTYKVYAMGIYMADEDIPLVSKILDSNFISKTFIDDNTNESLTHGEKIQKALNDPVKSEILVNSLLDGGVRFLIKMTPIIKSNLTFVREGGIVKSLKNSNEYTDPSGHEVIEKGINDIRKAFTHKGSLVINDDLIMELDKKNILQFYYYNIKQNKFYTMGHVDEPLIGKILFRNYLSAKKPLCEEARFDFVKKIVEIVG